MQHFLRKKEPTNPNIRIQLRFLVGNYSLYKIDLFSMSADKDDDEEVQLLVARLALEGTRHSS
jgi:hypothetical protein